MNAAVYRRGAVEVHNCGGALWIARAGDAILLDAPSGVERLTSALPGVGGLLAVLLSGGRIASVGGMLPLLCALDDARVGDLPLLVWSPMGDERPCLVLEAWNRGWPSRLGVTVESEVPGATVVVGAFHVATFPMRRLEGRPGSVIPSSAAAFRVSVDGCAVAFVPGGSNAGLVRHVCRGADLAVVEVGALSIADAVESVGSVPEVWLLGSDGELVGGDPT